MRPNVILLFFTVALVGGFILLKQITQTGNYSAFKTKSTKSLSLAIQKGNSHNFAILGATSTDSKQYVSTDGKYTVIYPATWLPEVLPQLQGFNGSVSAFTTGPVSEKINGFPSFIQIAVDTNPKGLTLDSYLSEKFGKNFSYSQVIVGGIYGKMTDVITGPVPNKTVFAQHNLYIYRIRFFDGAEPKITQNDFEKLLTRITFQ